MATDPGFAPAKINLALHVTGRRADGYHLLDGLVAFAAVGDRVGAEPDTGLSLRITGPMAAGLEAGEGNLVLRAARLLGGPGARLELEKVLPVASGIGGGSSDAAAALRVLARLWGLPLPRAADCAVLGADVPVCLDPRARVMRGIGEVLSGPVRLPEAWVVLANPGGAVPTPAVFAALTRRDNAPMPALPDSWADAAALAGWLRGCRNDLEAPAIAVAPVIGRVLAALGGQPGCLIARMSGSGATCFALFASAGAAAKAAQGILAAEPGWWVRDAALLGG
jgi:4-diphosphocytidyl-2-C-methyl-D-erythritol kinase